jgi:hypothetical protein
MPFILNICRSSHLFKIFALFDKVIRFYHIFDFINQNKKYEQAKNTTTKGKRTLPSRKHQAYLRIPNFMRGIYYYRNPSKHLIMKDYKEKPIRIKIPSFFIPHDLSRKYISIVKCERLVKKLKNN